MNCSSICKDIKVSRKDAAKIRLHGFITRDMIAQEGDPILKDVSYAKAKRICMFAKLSINVYNDEWVSLDYGDLDGLYLAYTATAPVENTVPPVEENADVVVEESSDDEEPVEGEETVEEEKTEEEDTARLVLSDEVSVNDAVDTTITESEETEKVSEIMSEESVVVRSEESDDEEEEVVEATDHTTRYPDYNNYNKHYQKKKKK